MKEETQEPGLLVKNFLWPILHPFGMLKGIQMWAKKPVSPPSYFVGNAILLAVSAVVSFGIGLRLTNLESLNSVALAAGAVAVWFVTLLVGLAGDLNGNLHPNDLYMKSLLAAPFWCLLGLFVYSLF